MFSVCTLSAFSKRCWKGGFLLEVVSPVTAECRIMLAESFRMRRFQGGGSVCCQPSGFEKADYRCSTWTTTTKFETTVLGKSSPEWILCESLLLAHFVLRDLLLAHSVLRDLLLAHSVLRDLLLAHSVLRDLLLAHSVLRDLLLAHSVLRDLLLAHSVLRDLLLIITWLCNLTTNVQTW